MKASTIIGLVITLLIGGGIWYYVAHPIGGTPSTTIGVKPGTTPYTYSNASADTIVVDTPSAESVVGKSFSVIGHARGTWFFEGSFPIQVIDQNGDVIATALATSTEPWMTNDMIPVRADLMVPTTYIGPATLVFKKDNPSGLPENDASLTYPITVQY